MGVMKMRNIAPRAGIEPTSLAFQASVLPLHHTGFLMSPLYPRLPVYAAPCLKGQCRLLHPSPWNNVSLLVPTNTYTCTGYGQQPNST